MRDAIGFRQQLSTTSFEASEMEITVNYPVHLNKKFQFYLMPFCLILLT